ncbi:MAG: Rne/Rng family ribonuclease [Clostridiales bacterium]|nr:Rne/Rng family ribonuclease [Clostridiales bacterium]
MNQIIVDVGIIETRLAILENKELVELYIERKGSKRILGNVYLGRVVNVLPGMQAAFVDIGLEKNCFLYVKEVINNRGQDTDLDIDKEKCISDIIKTGQEILVQIIKEAIEAKGARVTTNITLPGRYLVLAPFNKGIGISRKIDNENERERLKIEIEELKPKNMGVIVRTLAKGRCIEDFADDIKFLLRLWQKIEKKKKTEYAPQLIYKDFDLVSKTIRDIFNKEMQEFVINDYDTFSLGKDLVEIISPHLNERIFHYIDETDIFEKYDIEAQIAGSLNRKIWLDIGGYIVIDSTEALTVVDVNTGKYVGNTNLEDTVYKINIEAATEIAKQLRLRDIGGVIIVDFIDMSTRKHKFEVIKALNSELRKDRTKTKVVGMTRLGLVEITRKKTRKKLEATLKKKCTCCNGSGGVYSEQFFLNKIEKGIKKISKHTSCKAVKIQMNPNAADSLEEELQLIEELESKTNIKICLIKNDDLHYNELKIVRIVN